MIKFKSLKEYEELRNQDLVPPIIANAVIGDLLMIKEYLEEDYYNEEDVDKYGPYVVIMTREEYKNIEVLIPSINKDSYEYKDIVGIDNEGYITKLLYLFNNGESGIIIYVITHFNGHKQKFTGRTFMTRGVKENISDAELGYICKLIEIERLELVDNLDYLQVFEIKQVGDKETPIMMIHHRQENPGYNKVIYVPGVKCNNCKLFWISELDEEGCERSTLMFAEEY